MSAKERRDRQKQATREGILSAARKIARTEGWGAATIRRIADTIEYTPPVIYEYFASKDAILAALQRIGFEQLAEVMEDDGKKATDQKATDQKATDQKATDQKATDQTERLVQMGLAYWRFARHSPELYQVMHGWESALLPLEETLVGARKVSAVVEEVLEKWAEETGTIVSDPQGAVETMWALLLGLVAIKNMDRLGGDLGRAEVLVAQAIRDLLFAWANRPK